MESNVDSLVKASVGEIERILNTRNVCCKPLTVDGITFVPLVSAGFAFGARGAQNKTEAKQSNERMNDATGGGAWIRPKAVVVIDQKGVRIESVMNGASFAATKLGEAIPMVVDRIMGKAEQQKESQ